MSKKVLRTTIGVNKQELIVCLTKKSYTKEINKLCNVDDVTFDNSCTATLYGDNIEDNTYIIGINADTNMYSILQIEAFLINELTEVVDRHISTNDIDCNKYKSAVLQQLYMETKPFLDNYLSKKIAKKDESAEWNMSIKVPVSFDY